LNQAILEKVSAVAGVMGVALLEADGSCSANTLQAPYEPLLITEAAEPLRSALECYCGIDGVVPVKTLAIRSSHGHLLVRSLGERSIIAICGKSANLALVSVALNVAELKLTAQGRGAVAAPPALPPQATGPGSPPPPSPSQPAVPPMAWSASAGSESGGVGIKVMRHVLRTFQKYVGSRAQVVLEQELRLRGKTPATLDADQFADLIRAAARQVPDPEHRKRFISDVLGDKKRRRL
jgi:predicted regulator of Ras-like GTPase activity (Roadblock/LC7/MglB family)